MKLVKNQTNHSIIKKLCVILLLAISHKISADATLSYQSSNGNINFQLKNQQIFIKDVDPGIDILFDQTANHTIVIQHAKQSYSVLNEAEMKRINRQISGLQSTLTANLSSEQRSQLNDFLGGVLGSEKPQQAPTYALKNAGEAQVGQYLCQQAEVLENSKPIGLICSAKSQQLQLSQTDYNTLIAFQTFAVKASNILRDSIGAATQIELPDLSKTTLNEVLIFSKMNNQTDPDFYLQQINTQPITTQFKVPSNYQRQTLISASNLIR